MTDPAQFRYNCSRSDPLVVIADLAQRVKALEDVVANNTFNEFPVNLDPDRARDVLRFIRTKVPDEILSKYKITVKRNRV